MTNLNHQLFELTFDGAWLLYFRNLIIKSFLNFDIDNQLFLTYFQKE